MRDRMDAGEVPGFMRGKGIETQEMSEEEFSERGTDYVVQHREGHNVCPKHMEPFAKDEECSSCMTEEAAADDAARDAP